MENDLWKRKPKAVAGALLGSSLICGNTEAVILRADGYSRVDNEKDGLYRPLLEMSPGSLYCPRRRNAVLLLIVTSDGQESGGCVLVRAVEIDGVIYDGPGRVTERLGIRDHGLTGRIEVVSDDTLAIHLSGLAAPKKAMPKRIASGNGIGTEMLQRFMPKIVAKYLAVNPGSSFHDFLNRLLSESANEGDLRRALS